MNKLNRTLKIIVILFAFILSLFTVNIKASYAISVGNTLTIGYKNKSSNSYQLWGSSNLYCVNHVGSLSSYVRNNYKVKYRVDIIGNRAKRSDKNKAVYAKQDAALGYIFNAGNFPKGYQHRGTRQYAVWGYWNTWLDNVGKQLGISYNTWKQKASISANTLVNDAKNYADNFDKSPMDGGCYVEVASGCSLSTSRNEVEKREESSPREEIGSGAVDANGDGKPDYNDKNGDGMYDVQDTDGDGYVDKWRNPKTYIWEDCKVTYKKEYKDTIISGMKFNYAKTCSISKIEVYYKKFNDSTLYQKNLSSSKRHWKINGRDTTVASIRSGESFYLWTDREEIKNVKRIKVYVKLNVSGLYNSQVYFLQSNSGRQPLIWVNSNKINGSYADSATIKSSNTIGDIKIKKSGGRSDGSQVIAEKVLSGVSFRIQGPRIQ